MKRCILLGALVSCALASMASAGTILRQEWDEDLGLSRQAIIDFLVDLANPEPEPDVEEVMTESFYHGDHKDNYVAKFYGWITVPETGTYAFHYACDDYGMLYVSQDEKMENAEEVAYVDGWCADAEWNKYPDTQHSEPMELKRGQVMAVMAFYVEDGGGDNMDIGWTGPGLSSDETNPTYVTDWITHIPPIITIAKDGQPAPDAVDVRPETALSWQPGLYAATHDVYFGTVFDDVNDATREDPRDVLVSQGQTETTYDPPGRLDLGQTYYWRIDEVNGAPDFDIFKGDVWSFTAEPVAYPIEGITVTSNTTSSADQGPEKLVDGSGLNADDQHATTTSTMWVGTPPEEGAPYLEFEFDRVYKLHEMLVWNYNVDFEWILGFGVKDATLEYSADGADWTVLGDAALNQAPGTSTYAYNTAVPLDGVPAKYVRMTINSSWNADATRHGMAEIRFTYIPAHAREPEPADSATGVSLDTGLAWRSGREAASHEVYLSEDPNALLLAGTTTQSSFSPAALDLNTTYYWKVDEVNNAEEISLWESSLWSFATQEYIEIDGFEAYDDDVNTGTTIWQTWIDGFETTSGNGGALVGNDPSPFAEMAIVHSGSQSMPLFYENAGPSDFSEADRAITPGQNWTTGKIRSLSFWFYGDLDNAGQLYVKINGTKVLYDGDPADIARTQWHPWNIDLSTVGGNLTNVTEMSIGIQGTGAGVLYIDDVRLYPHEPQKITPTDPEPTGLAAHYTFDEGAGTTVGDSSGNGNTGTVVGDPIWVPGVINGAMEFDGTVYVNCGNGPSLQIRDAITIACWIKIEAFTVSWEAIVAKGDTSYRMSRGDELGDSVHFGCNGPTGGNLSGTAIVTTDTWRHAAVVFDGAYNRVYIDGAEDARVASTGQIDENTNDLYIGENSGATGRQLGGLVDDVRIYNRALSPEEIAGLAGRTTPIHVGF